MIDAIFDLFVQPNRILERAQGGLGVGLTVVKSLVEMHGGSIEVQSDARGKGSTFTIHLPLPSSPSEKLTTPRSFAQVGQGLRVVVVEDNIDAREMLCHLLTRAGFDCESVGDGLASLALIDSFEPHAAIVDVGLPGLDGFEVARRIRRKDKHPRPTSSP